MEKTLPGFDKIVNKIQHDFYTRIEKLTQKKNAEKREARKKAGLPEYEWHEKSPYEKSPQCHFLHDFCRSDGKTLLCLSS